MTKNKGGYLLVAIPYSSAVLHGVPKLGDLLLVIFVQCGAVEEVVSQATRWRRGDILVDETLHRRYRKHR